MNGKLFDDNDDDAAPNAHLQDVVRKDEKATRDGPPKLAGERKRRHLMFRRRYRAGPNWVPRDRRP